MKRNVSLLSMIVLTSFALISCSSTSTTAQQQSTAQQPQINLYSSSTTDLLQMNVSKTLLKKTPAPKNIKATNKTYKVEIKNFKFSPATLTIKKGDKVTWTNLDSMAHTATGANFDSGNLNNGASYSFVFNKAGTFNYVCSYHSNMTAKIIVK